MHILHVVLALLELQILQVYYMCFTNNMHFHIGNRLPWSVFRLHQHMVRSETDWLNCTIYNLFGLTTISVHMDCSETQRPTCSSTVHHQSLSSSLWTVQTHSKKTGRYRPVHVQSITVAEDQSICIQYLITLFHPVYDRSIRDARNIAHRSLCFICLRLEHLKQTAIGLRLVVNRSQNAKLFKTTSTSLN